MNAMASAASPAKTTRTPLRLMAFCVTGNASMTRKLASQSIIAQNAAAWPRTAVGNTSPCSVQPVPPTPIANEAMKKSRPIAQRRQQGELPVESGGHPVVKGGEYVAGTRGLGHGRELLAAGSPAASSLAK